ncbi:Fur family transcriptional regulator [Xanthobacter agilis]|uniref:Fur family transcriptional regulator n=1 Tax=Xanthobacter agilis TaxID=47492 RepID=UPI00372C656D
MSTEPAPKEHPPADIAADHDHAQCVATAVARMEACCAHKGLRLTALRRNVTRLLAASHTPLGAYEIVEQLAAAGESSPPMSVYRALDFLVAEGLAHRIESRNAFLACAHPHDADEVVVFLICERCGLTREVAAHAVGRDLAWAARAAGFTPRQRVLEVAGLCAHCRAAETSARPVEPPASGA